MTQSACFYWIYELRSSTIYMIWTSAKQLVDSIVFPNLLQIIVKPFVGFIYSVLNFFEDPLTVQYTNIWVLFKYFNMQSLKSSIWNGETSLHPAYKVTLIASLNREGFGSAIIPVGPIGHLVLRIDLPSFGQYSIGVDGVIRLKCAGTMMKELEIMLLALAESS